MDDPAAESDERVELRFAVRDSPHAEEVGTSRALRDGILSVNRQQQTGPDHDPTRTQQR